MENEVAMKYLKTLSLHVPNSLTESAKRRS